MAIATTNPVIATGAFTIGLSWVESTGLVVKARFDWYSPPTPVTRARRAASSLVRVNDSLNRFLLPQNFGTHESIASSSSSEPAVGTAGRSSRLHTLGNGLNVTGNTNRLRQLEAVCHSW